MPPGLTDMFTSKKFLAAIAASVVYGIGRFVFHLEPEALDRLVELAMVYIGAQGIADHGKPAAQIAAAAAVKVAELTTMSAPIAAPAAAGSPAGRNPFGPIAILALVLIVLGGGAALPACGGTTSTRAATIGSLQTGVQTASAALRSYEHDRAMAIVAAATDKASGLAQLGALRTQVDKAWFAVDAARAAIDAANTINDETSLAGARAALTNAITAIATITGRTP